MSERNTSRPARFWPPLTMPNSDACLIELMVSPPALARPMILAFDDCACSRNDEKSVPVKRVAHLAEHLAAVLQHHRLGVALERVAEGVVGGQEEPGVAAGLDDRAAGAVGEHPGVVGPVDGVGRAGLAGQVGRRRAGVEEGLASSPCVIWLTASATDEVGTSTITSTLSVSYHCAGDARADVGLVLVVGRDDLDLHALARRRRSPRPPCCAASDRARAGEVGVEARHVVQHADLDDVVRDLGAAARGRRRTPGRAATATPPA